MTAALILTQLVKNMVWDLTVFQAYWDSHSELLTVLVISYMTVNIVFLMLIHAGGSPEQRWNLPDDVCQFFHSLYLNFFLLQVTDVDKYPLIKQATRHIVRSSGNVDLVAWCKGKGPSILLLHTLGGNSTQFAFLFKRLSIKGYRLITYDMRGHGQSSKASTYSQDDLTTDLKSVLDYFKCDGATIVGYGLGGYVAQSLFLNHQEYSEERAAKLILLSSFSVSPCTLWERIYLVSVSSGLLHAFCRSKVLSRVIARRVFGFAANRTMLEEWRRSILNTPPNIWKQTAAATKSDLRKLNVEISIPTLIICGDQDIFYSACQKTHFPHVRAHAERVWLDRMGHLTPWEAPDRLTSIICHFVPSSSVSTLWNDSSDQRSRKSTRSCQD
jgi:pimeloyl-ACP methyl ester carboxylesterase